MGNRTPSGTPSVYASTPMWHDADKTGSLPSTARLRADCIDRAQAIRSLQGDQQLVYALRLADGTIKIGCTANLAQRYRSYPGCQVIGFRAGDFDDEAAIHADLVPHRARGREYYHPAPEVIAVVNDMRIDFGLPPLAA